MRQLEFWDVAKINNFDHNNQEACLSKLPIDVGAARETSQNFNNSIARLIINLKFINDARE